MDIMKSERLALRHMSGAALSHGSDVDMVPCRLSRPQMDAEDTRIAAIGNPTQQLLQVEHMNSARI
jgi:hypothetical protein